MKYVNRPQVLQRQKDDYIWERMSKDEINECPLRRYEGPVQVINTESALAAAVRSLEQETILGFDTETKPSYRKGESYSPALLQLAGANAVFIFQLKSLGLPRILLNILTNRKIIKAGVSLDYDLRELKALVDFEPKGFVDIGELAKNVGIKNHGLRGLTSVLLGFRISKTSRTSNWEKKNLTPPQIAYAATDAWAGRELYKEIQNYL